MPHSAAVRNAISEWLRKNHCTEERDEEGNLTRRCSLHDDEIVEAVNATFGETLLGGKLIGKAAASSIRKGAKAQPPKSRRVVQEDSCRGKFGEGKQNLFNRVTILEKAVRYLDEHVLHLQKILEVESGRRIVSIGATQLGRGSEFPPLVGPPPATPLSKEGTSYGQIQALHDYRARIAEEEEKEASSQ